LENIIINTWFTKYEKAAQEYLTELFKRWRAPIFTSVDVRNAGFKIAPVDTNLFPAGFNNLGETGVVKLQDLLSGYIHHYFAAVKRIVIFPENFTRNQRYLESLGMLLNALQNSGFDACIASSLIHEDLEIENLKIFNINALEQKGWHPDLILLNNDLTDGIPQYLQLTKARVIPSSNLGWHTRRKHEHFQCYSALVEEFCNNLGIDPWLLNTEFTMCEDIDFKTKEGLGCIAAKTEIVLGKIKDKYLQHGIKLEPSVFVKPNQGTYGMGVMIARSPEEIMGISKRKRHSMNSLKHGVNNHEVIIQEGVPTIESVTGATAETMAYLCGGQMIELFMRTHPERDALSNLNTRGMVFHTRQDQHDPLVHFIAKLASMATNLEPGA
jgi:glutamate--cysteine ligase